MSLNKFKESKRNDICRRMEIDIWGNLKFLSSRNSRIFRKFYKRYQRRFRSNTFMFRLDNNKPNKPRKYRSMYGLGMLAKQSFRYFLGNVPEKHFRKFFVQIRKYKRDQYYNLVRNIESRLISIIMRASFFSTPYQIKQLILHGHVFVNSSKVTNYYFRLKIGDYVHFSTLAESIIKKRFTRFNVKDGVIRPPVQHLEISYNIFRIILSSVPLPNMVEYPFKFDPFKIINFYKS